MDSNLCVWFLVWFLVGYLIGDVVFYEGHKTLRLIKLILTPAFYVAAAMIGIIHGCYRGLRLVFFGENDNEKET